MKRPWIYLENPMETASANSFRLASRIDVFHITLIKGRVSEPLFLELFNNYNPAHEDFHNKYINWKVAKARQLTKTVELNKIVRELMSDKIQNWESQIIVVYGKRTPKYKALLANGKRPFQNGAVDMRQQEVVDLITAIGSDIALASLKTQVETFNMRFENAMRAQIKAKTEVTDLSRDTEKARKEMCIKQYENLAIMIKARARETHNIGRYFDLKAMRRRQQVLYTGQVKMKTVKTIAKHTFEEGEQVELENTGITVMQFYIGSAKKQQPGNEVITLAPGTKKTIAVKREDSVSKPYLMVYNSDEVNKGEFAVEFL